MQRLEGVEETPQIKFGFSEVAGEFIVEPKDISRVRSCVQGRISLRAIRRPELGERTLTVEYHLSNCDLNPEKFLLLRRKGGKKK